MQSFPGEEAEGAVSMQPPACSNAPLVRLTPSKEPAECVYAIVHAHCCEGMSVYSRTMLLQDVAMGNRSI